VAGPVPATRVYFAGCSAPSSRRRRRSYLLREPSGFNPLAHLYFDAVFCASGAPNWFLKWLRATRTLHSAISDAALTRKPGVRPILLGRKRPFELDRKSLRPSMNRYFQYIRRMHKLERLCERREH